MNTEPLTIYNEVQEFRPYTIVPDYHGVKPDHNPYEIQESTAQELYHYYKSLPNSTHADISQKRWGFMMLGLPDEEVDELCKPKELDRETIIRDCAEYMIEGRKLLEKENRVNRKRILQEAAINKQISALCNTSI